MVVICPNCETIHITTRELERCHGCNKLLPVVYDARPKNAKLKQVRKIE